MAVETTGGLVFRIMLIPFMRRCGQRKESVMDHAFSRSHFAQPITRSTNPLLHPFEKSLRLYMYIHITCALPTALQMVNGRRTKATFRRLQFSIGILFIIIKCT